MVVEPKMRGFICLTAHPEGCKQNVINQINYVKGKGEINAPKRVLVIGCSQGFGLASRITSSYGSGASTLGIMFEKPSLKGKPASSGWYNTVAFEEQAHADGLYAKTINGDAFSDEIKEVTFDMIKEDLGQVDLVIYSLAAPRRTRPQDGITYSSVLKPIGNVFNSQTVDFHTGKVSDVSIEPASEEEIADTVKVMGGEDWQMWIEALKEKNLLADGATTVAYSYIGPDLTCAVYRKGAIGQAKADLEATAHKITEILAPINGKGYISVNKALVTQASSAIPVMPLYISLLFHIMKEQNIHEGCIEQIQRMYQEKLFNDGEVILDEEGRIRVDDWEMKDSVQNAIVELWNEAIKTDELTIGDLEGYRNDFYNLFGFGIEGVDYSADVEVDVKIPSIKE